MPTRFLQVYRCALVATIMLSALAGCAPTLVGVLPGADGGETFGVAPNEVDDVAAAQTAVKGAECTAVGEPRTAEHRMMLDELNAFRRENGLGPLIYSKTLERSADGMAADIAIRNFFDHVDPDGNSPVERALAAGFCHKYVGENLATGFEDVASVMEGWKASEGHRVNMLHPDYAYVGMGVFRTPQRGAVWVQEFAFDPEIVALRTAAAPAR